MIGEIQNKIHLNKLKKENSDFLIIIFYTDSSENSKKALDILKMVKEENPKAPICGVNASKVKDIHPIYGINTVPAVLVLKKGKNSNIIYGVQDKRYYKILLHYTPISTSTRKEGEKQQGGSLYLILLKKNLKKEKLLA